MKKMTAKQRFKKTDKILEKLANLDSKYLLGKMKRMYYLKSRNNLKKEFININLYNGEGGLKKWMNTNKKQTSF